MTLKEQLLRDEGLRLKPYRDTVGKLTIGVGRNLDDKGISESEAMELLDNDVADTSGALLKALPWTANLHGPRFGALVNLAFNMGIGGLLEFKKMLAAIKTEKWDVAAAALLDSKYATQVGARAKRLAKQLQTGVMQ